MGVHGARAALPDKLISLTTYSGGGNALDVLKGVKESIDFAMEDSYGYPSGFFTEMKNIVGEHRVYYGIECDFPKTALSETQARAAAWTSSGAAGVFLWTANRDTSKATSCLDPVNGGPSNHPFDWAYTQSIRRGMMESTVVV